MESRKWGGEDAERRMLTVQHDLILLEFNDIGDWDVVLAHSFKLRCIILVFVNAKLHSNCDWTTEFFLAI